MPRADHHHITECEILLQTTFEFFFFFSPELLNIQGIMCLVYIESIQSRLKMLKMLKIARETLI